MSLEDNTKATKAITLYSANSHKVEWTIECVSHLQECATIDGPEFKLHDSKMVFTVLKDEKHLSISLNDTSNRTFQMDSSIVFLDCEGTKLYERIKQAENMRRHKYIYFSWELQTLKNDQLKIHCSFKMLQHVTKRLRTLKSQEEYQKNLFDDLKTIYNNPDGSDFTLQVGEDLIYAHKTILRLRSTYFKNMFETNMKEKIQNSMVITDASYSTMKKLIEFLYTGTFTIEGLSDINEEVRNLYIAADKYQLLDLRSLCADKLLSFATPENILQTLQFALSYNDNFMKTEAMDFVFFHFEQILKTSAWKTFLSSDEDLAFEIMIFCFKK